MTQANVTCSTDSFGIVAKSTVVTIYSSNADAVESMVTCDGVRAADRFVAAWGQASQGPWLYTGSGWLIPVIRPVANVL